MRKYMLALSVLVALVATGCSAGDQDVQMETEQGLPTTEEEIRSVTVYRSPT